MKIKENDFNGYVSRLETIIATFDLMNKDLKDIRCIVDTWYENEIKLTHKQQEIVSSLEDEFRKKENEFKSIIY